MEYLFANVAMYALLATIISGLFTMDGSGKNNMKTKLVFKIGGFVGTIGLFVFLITTAIAMLSGMVK